MKSDLCARMTSVVSSGEVVKRARLEIPVQKEDVAVLARNSVDVEMAGI